MKIVHIAISCFYIEGAGYQENLLPSAHVAMGHDVTMISSQYCFDGQGKRQVRESGTYQSNSGFKVVILPDTAHLRFGLDYFKRKVKGLYNTLQVENPDIIFMHGLTAVDSLDVVRYVKNHKHVRYYADQHGDYYNTHYDNLLGKFVLKFVHKPIAKKVAEQASMIWGTTPWRVQYLREIYGVPVEKSSLLVMGADEKLIDWDNRIQIRSDVRSKYGIKEDDFLIVTGGKINKAKNTHLLAEAVTRLRHSNVKLLIFGKMTDDMIPVFDEFAKDQRIINAGWVKSDFAYQLFLASDLGCFPGTHSVLWEQAVACGLPTIYMKWAGMQHVNVNGNAILLDDVNVDVLENVLNSFVKDNTIYEEIKELAQKARSEFYYSIIGQRSIENEDL